MLFTNTQKPEPQSLQDAPDTNEEILWRHLIPNFHRRRNLFPFPLMCATSINSFPFAISTHELTRNGTRLSNHQRCSALIANLLKRLPRKQQQRNYYLQQYLVLRHSARSAFEPVGRDAPVSRACMVSGEMSCLMRKHKEINFAFSVKT